MSDVFAPSGPKVYSIPAGANFLGEMAATLTDALDLKRNPEALADALIYVPNRRSERALAFALHQSAGGKACLLPSIRALGDLETDDPPPSAEAALADLPPVISPAYRIGALTRLVMAYSESNGTELPAVSSLAASRELARLLDQAALSGEVDWAELEHLVPDAQLAEHWQRSVRFLKIITDQWPAHLDEKTAMDPYARRYAAAVAMAEHWHEHRPDAPVIIAGSTGATPASRVLMQAALNLPRGLVILPGLDTDLDAATLHHIKTSPSHPQFALARTLDTLKLDVGQVAPWPTREDSAFMSARRRLIHAALAPADSTADWTSKLADLAGDSGAAAFVRSALDGLATVQAKDENEEALLAASLLRETLEQDSITAALITPDAGLARHVSALLKRWDIDVAPSSGLPLSQSHAGSLFLLVAEWMLDFSHPVTLMSVLQHPACQFGMDSVRSLDKYFLRGPRRWQSWPELRAHMETLKADTGARFQSIPDPEADAAMGLIEALSEILSGATFAEHESCSGEAWLRQVSALATAIGTAPQPWAGEDGAALSTLVRELTELSEPLGPQAPVVWNELLRAEAAAISVPAGAPHPRLAIWGPLEARLQTADRIVLAGLNEDVWPAQPPADAFLPRRFRQEIGLADPDERIGLSAHDFAQLASAPNVTLLSSRRREDKPAIASRWLWRLQTLARGALDEAAKTALAPPAECDPRDWLTHLESSPPPAPGFTAKPQPRPPVSARPTRLSVTRVENLVRDPYSIYCESVLGLRPLDPLDLPADVRVRGTAIHKALERFEEEASAGDVAALLGLVEEELRHGGEPQADLIGLRDKRREVCSDYIQWRAGGAHQLSGPPLTELKGRLSLDLDGQSFTLTGTADRIEKRQDGSVAILDFKTGGPPSEKQVRSGLSPQMPLQGLIAREGGYPGLGHAKVEALTYIRFGTAFEVRDLGAESKLHEAKTADELITDARTGLIQLLSAFANPDHPYLSAPRPERVAYESAFTRLARRDEWTGLTTYD